MPSTVAPVPSTVAPVSLRARMRAQRKAGETRRHDAPRVIIADEVSEDVQAPPAPPMSAAPTPQRSAVRADSPVPTTRTERASASPFEAADAANDARSAVDEHDQDVEALALTLRRGRVHGRILAAAVVTVGAILLIVALSGDNTPVTLDAPQPVAAAPTTPEPGPVPDAPLREPGPTAAAPAPSLPSSTQRRAEPTAVPVETDPAPAAGAVATSDETPPATTDPAVPGSAPESPTVAAEEPSAPAAAPTAPAVAIVAAPEPAAAEPTPTAGRVAADVEPGPVPSTPHSVVASAAGLPTTETPAPAPAPDEDPVEVTPPEAPTALVAVAHAGLEAAFAGFDSADRHPVDAPPGDAAADEAPELAANDETEAAAQAAPVAEVTPRDDERPSALADEASPARTLIGDEARRRDNPATGAEWYAAGRRLASTSPRDALYALRRAVTHGYSVAYRDIGRIEAERGNRTAALTAYRRYLAARPSGGDAARIRAQITRLGGR